ncbi:transporter [Niastella koreensis]|uniref:Outer membrane efflux protein n=2 Tax=Niastella koreensis TaxID=354356 RepID=G8TES9_NIAKG|nr:TolC family protein [Niastella koreensis]AEW00515.1 outer membrane efflux protein [Niastella koreensis GR20-10]OQP52375.1 transporter [Niastella koreensis]
MCSTKNIGSKCRSSITAFRLIVLIFMTAIAQAQPVDGNTYKLTLAEAVQFAKTQNKLVQAACMEESAAEEDRKDAYNAALPAITANGSYQRFTDLTLFTHGLSHSTTGPRKPTPNGATLGVDALFNIYSGGKQRALQSEQRSKLQLARLNAMDQSGNVALQTAHQYLELLRLNDLQKLILDQLNRAQTRLNNINTLYKNQKVTKSDVLRAEVLLSNVQLSLQENENDLTITNQKLDVLLNVPDTVQISPVDSAAMPKPAVSALLPFVEAAGVTNYSVQKATESIELQKARLKGIESSNKPSIGFYTAYGLNYPNYLFFPPVNQAYAIGFVGLKAQYSISSLYHNKSKLAAGKLRVKELEVQQQAYNDNVRTEAHSWYIKYAEALTRIEVNERSVEQAQVNYRIVNTKYLNQLSLLTDLLDADNLYQESRFNLIKAQTNALNIYYSILYISGNL